jgi:hypothetical protein
MKFFIKNRFIRYLLVALNMMVACLPFWRTGIMVICKCGGHISIELKDYDESMVCCNDCEMEKNRIESSPLMCSCTGIPVSKDFNGHAACYTNTEEYDKTVLWVDQGLSQFIDSHRQNRFYPLAHYPATGNNAIDILRTNILQI